MDSWYLEITNRFRRHVVPGGGGGTWVNFCWVCAAGLSEPLPHYSLFCDLLGKMLMFKVCFQERNSMRADS